MLALDHRRLFLEALKPPDGFAFDRAVGTTYTLDLTALLITPLALSWLDRGSIEESISDPILALEGLRRFADRITIFCQAGHISIPREFNQLYHYLEDQVVEVQAPNGGVFHPKVWLLRYTSNDELPLYRLLCMSRNLTFDKSWDLMAQLDGKLAARKVAFSRNHPLGNFIGVLPELATHQVSERVHEDIALLSDEVRRVDFKAPSGFRDDFVFVPSGIAGYQKGFMLDRPYDRALVLAPFLTDDILKRITNIGTNHVLISDPDALDTIAPSTIRRFYEVFSVDSTIWDQDVEDLQEESGERLAPPTGLHAKLFVLNKGWDATWLIGSANATRSALHGFSNRNVEFMLELTGKRSEVGIDHLLGAADEEVSLRNVLRKYEPPDALPESDLEKVHAEQLANDVRAWLISLQYKAIVSPMEGDSEAEYQLSLLPGNSSQAPAGDYQTRAWLVSTPESHKLILDLKTPQFEFAPLSILALTPFVALEVMAKVNDAIHRVRFVLRVPISGLPNDRLNHIIRAVVADKAQFVRYLRLLLSDHPDDYWASDLWRMHEESYGSSRQAAGADIPLLEELVRAFSRSPEKIQEINKIVERLKATPEGQEVLPDGFDALWKQILAASEGVQ